MKGEKKSSTLLELVQNWIWEKDGYENENSDFKKANKDIKKSALKEFGGFKEYMKDINSASIFKGQSSFRTKKHRASIRNKDKREIYEIKK